MILRYKQVFGYVLLAVGTLSLFVNLWVYLLTAQLSLLAYIFLGLVMILLGYGYLTKPMAILEPNSLIIKAMYGPVQKIFDFRSFEDLKIENNRLFVRNLNGGWEKTQIAKSMMKKQDWLALQEMMKSRSLTR